MRIIATFLSVVLTALLFMLPITSVIYDFRTDEYSQTFYDNTSAATSENISLFKAIYNNDYTNPVFASTLATDNATPGTYYDATSHVLTVTGLTAGGTRDLTVTYDVDAITTNTAFVTFLNMIPWLWYLFLVAVLGVSIFAIWRRGEM